MAELYGVDVSEFQGNINWDALNAAANFVIIRASFGTLRQDHQFLRNQSEARRVRESAGPLGIGYYYFAYPTLLDPIVSADYFVDNLGPLQEGEILVLDLEGQIGSNPVGWSKSFLDHVRSRTTVSPLIYLNQSEVSGYDWSPVVSAGYGLWIADYDNSKDAVPPHGVWPFAAIKQWTDVDVINGVVSKTDGDTFYGDFNAFYSYGYHAPHSTPPAPVVPAAPQPVQAPVAPPVEPVVVPAPVVAPAASTQPTVAPTDTYIWSLVKAFLKWLFRR